MDQKREYFITLQRELINSGAFPTCFSCQSFDRKEEVCVKDGYNGKVPMKIAVTGCVNWVMDIPF